MSSPSDRSIIEPRLLKGFRDILPSQMAIRQYMIGRISQTMAQYGFLPLETPVLEYADILLGKLGDEGEKLLYKFEDHGQRQVAMRYDLTVPLARVVAQYSQLAKPFKRYQVGPVWRADNSQRGRYREFYQFDADIVGSASPLADAEILVLIQQVLLDVGVTDFIIRVSDRQLVNKLADQLSLNAIQTNGMFKILDNLEKVNWDDSQQALHQLGLSTTDIDLLRQQLLKPDQDLAQQAPHLHYIIQLAKQLGLQDKYIKFDPSIVRGLDYYSGMVFETTLTSATAFGSIFSGGRYDHLVSRFSKQDLPAVGASVGLDRLLAALEEVDQLPALDHPTQVYVTLFDDQATSIEASLKTAQQLRQQGITTDLAYQPSSIGKQCKAAAEAGIAWAIIIGPDEQSTNFGSLRNLSTKQEQSLTLDQAIAHIKAN